MERLTNTNLRDIGDLSIPFVQLEFFPLIFPFFHESYSWNDKVLYISRNWLTDYHNNLIKVSLD